MLPSPHDLRYFLEVVRTKNISRAAERLGISQPSLSMALKRLEGDLGTNLLIRSRSGVQISKSGERLAQSGRRLFEYWESVHKDTLDSEHEVTGRFTIGCHPSVARIALPVFLVGILNEHSQVEFSLNHKLSRKVTEDVISSRTDFGFVVNPVAHPDLVIRELFTDEVGFWTKSDKNQDTLLYDPNMTQAQSLFGQTKKNLQFRRIIDSTSLEALAELCKLEAGVAILPKRVAQSCDPSLKWLDPELPRYQDSHCLIYRADSQKSAAAKEIVRLIKETKFK